MRKEKFEVDGGKCMSDLYVSDLDGTLLRSNEVTSKYTNQVINSLVEEGMIFSYATARSLVTAKKVTEGINAKIPLIVYNGAFVIDNITEKILIANYFDDSVHSVLEDLFSIKNRKACFYRLNAFWLVTVKVLNSYEIK